MAVRDTESQTEFRWQKVGNQYLAVFIGNYQFNLVTKKKFQYVVKVLFCEIIEKKFANLLESKLIVFFSNNSQHYLSGSWNVARVDVSGNWCFDKS